MNDIFEEIEFEQFVAGNPVMFQKAFDFYFPIIFRYALSKGIDREDAEDITQEAFTLLFLHRGHLRTSRDLYPFLFVISKRLCISFFRRKLSGSKTIHGAYQEWSSISLQIDKDLDYKELNLILQKIITSLPPQQQEIYRRFKLEEHSQKEIAESMGISRHTVKNHLQVASKLVRLKLQKIYFLLF